jgi:hypothetical protein
MMLTETQISHILGYVVEPIQNKMNPQHRDDIHDLMMAMGVAKQQRITQVPTSHTWMTFLPWHSVN